MSLDEFFDLFDASHLLIDCTGLEFHSEMFQKLYEFMRDNDYHPWNGDGLMDYLTDRLTQGGSYRFLKTADALAHGYRSLSCCRRPDERKCIHLRELSDMISDDKEIETEDFETILD